MATIIIASCGILVGVFGLFWFASGSAHRAREPKTDWYAHGPWRVTSNGVDICLQKGAETPLPAYIGAHIIYDSSLHSRAEKAETCVQTGRGYDGRKAYVDEIPLLKLRCAQLNQHEQRKAEAQGWAELGEQA